MRIVSLVPCLTETVAGLGAMDQLVGVTRYCVHPTQLPNHVERVGGVRDPDVERIIALEPDLVLMDREENRAQDASVLGARCELLVSNVSCVKDVAPFLQTLGQRIGCESQSELVTKELRALPSPPPPSGDVAVVLWPEPLVLAGRDTYIADVVRHLGWKLWAPSDERYPRLRRQQLVDAAPKLVLLPTEPHRFTPEEAQEWAACLPRSRVLIVDGEDLCWYGARTTSALRRLDAATRIAAPTQ